MNLQTWESGLKKILLPVNPMCYYERVGRLEARLMAGCAEMGMKGWEEVVQ